MSPVSGKEVQHNSDTKISTLLQQGLNFYSPQNCRKCAEDTLYCGKRNANNVSSGSTSVSLVALVVVAQ